MINTLGFGRFLVEVDVQLTFVGQPQSGTNRTLVFFRSRSDSIGVLSYDVAVAVPFDCLKWGKTIVIDRCAHPAVLRIDLIRRRAERRHLTLIAIEPQHEI